MLFSSRGHCWGSIMCTFMSKERGYYASRPSKLHFDAKKSEVGLQKIIYAGRSLSITYGSMSQIHNTFKIIYAQFLALGKINCPLVLPIFITTVQVEPGLLRGVAMGTVVCMAVVAKTTDEVVVLLVPLAFVR